MIATLATTKNSHSTITRRLSGARIRKAPRRVRLGDCYVDQAHPCEEQQPLMLMDARPWILHIDDDAELVAAMTIRLERCGYRVTGAYDAINGIQSAIMRPASAIVLDYDMPGEKGDHVIKELKGNPRTENIPIVVLTAVEKKSLERRLLSMGAKAFLTKPFDFDMLQSTISDLVIPSGD